MGLQSLRGQGFVQRVLECWSVRAATCRGLAAGQPAAVIHSLYYITCYYITCYRRGLEVGVVVEAAEHECAVLSCGQG